MVTKNRSRSRGFGAGVAAALFAVCWSVTVTAQLDPLYFMKRVPPTVIVVMDTSLAMLEDGAGNFYDPSFYKVADDPTVMGAFALGRHGQDLSAHLQEPASPPHRRAGTPLIRSPRWPRPGIRRTR